MNEQLQKMLAEWDGQAVEPIESVYQQYRELPDFAEQLLTMAAQVNTAVGATWLLKAYLQDGGECDADECYLLGPGFSDWQARLHLLQSMERLPISEARRQSVEYWLRYCVMDDNKMVRAWAYNGLYLLQKQFPQYTDEVKDLIERGQDDDSKAVQARIRQIKAKGF